jgi:hypothetical protein
VSARPLFDQVVEVAATARGDHDRMPGPTASLRTARDYVQTHSTEATGATCPCCGRLVRMYRYRVSRTQAQFLVAMARSSARATGYRDARAWIDLRTVGGQFSAGMRLGGKYAKLRHWGLLEAHPHQRATWRLTQRAVDWLAGRVLVPQYVYLLDNVLQGYDDALVSFDQALGQAFDLDDAMRAPDGLRGS